MCLNVAPVTRQESVLFQCKDFGETQLCKLTHCTSLQHTSQREQ